MAIVHKPTFLILIVFIVFMNLTAFSDSRATILANHDSKRVDPHESRTKREDERMITIADLTRVTPVEPHRGSSGGLRFAETGKDDQGALFFNGLTQDSYGASYDGYGYGNPYPGGSIFGFPRGLFGFPRGLFRFPRGIFGFPGDYGNPGVYGVNPGSYGGYPGSYGARYPGGYGGGHPGDKPGGGGYAYGGKAEVKGK